MIHPVPLPIYYDFKVVFSTNKDILLHIHNPSNQDQKMNSDHYYQGILTLYLSLASCPSSVTFSNKIQLRICHCI